MFKLAPEELQQAYEAIEHHGYSAMLPASYEWQSVRAKWTEVQQYLAEIDLDVYTPYKPLRVFAPKSRANIRVVHLLHPEDLIGYTALVLIVKDDIEGARMSRKTQRVFSYRVDNKRPNRLYDSRGAYDAYLSQLRKKTEKANVTFVSIADIADFYPRIYQHRLENVVESTASSQRGVDVARVLVKKLISKLMDGNSYGIPVGPYASRVLGEAVLIDVDAHLHAKGVDFVRWVDDYNIFSRTEYLAQSTVFELAEWLFSNHGLTLQSSKTKILPVARYASEVISVPEENLTDRDHVISLLRESAGDVEYEEDLEEEEDPDEEAVAEMLQQLQGYDLHDMFVASISDQALVDYEMVRYVLTRLPRISGADDDLKSDILELVLDRADLLYPAAEFIARYILSFDSFSKSKKKKIAKQLLKPLKSKRSQPPDYYAMWILYIFSTSEDWNHAGDIVALYQRSTSEVVKRFAALAIAVGGTRSEALVVKDDLPNASDLLRLAILCASNRLGKDERKHWKLANQVHGAVEKYV